MVRWAPRQLPLQRRLQTVGILIGLGMLPAAFTLIFAMMFFPPFVAWHSREFLGAYLLWQILFDRRTGSLGGRPIQWLRNLFIWNYIAEYFPAYLHVKKPFQEGKPRIFCLHPHGIISIAAVCNLVFGSNEPNKHLGVDYRVATVSFNFLLPFWRDLIMGVGFINASKDSISHVLKQSKSVMIVIGGAQETLHANPGLVELVLKKRTGFIKLALKHGAELVPVFHFGENELYAQVQHPVLRRLQDMATSILGFTIPAVRGRGVFQYDFGLLPRRVPLHTVVGDPIAVPHIPNPTREDIEKYHDIYIKALEQLYNDNKDEFAHPTDFHGNPITPGPLKIVA